MNPSREMSKRFSENLPSAEETMLLRACLLFGEAARSAWDDWRSLTGVDFVGNHPTVRQLRPQLFEAGQRFKLNMGKANRNFLKLAYFKEGLRQRIFQRISGKVLTSLSRANIPAIVLKGAALGETVYAPSIRHCHDIDILLQETDVELATAVIATLNFRNAASDTTRSVKSVCLEHDSGLPVELHTQLFCSTANENILDEIRHRAERVSIFGVPVQILRPEDNLLHVCGHASYSKRRQSLRWVTDAWFIIDRHPDLDWELLLRSAMRSKLALPLSVMLGYMAEKLNASIPFTFLSRLSAAASKNDPVEDQLAQH